MPGFVVKVDDRALLTSFIAAGLVYLGVALHQAYFVPRNSVKNGRAQTGASGAMQHDTTTAGSAQTRVAWSLERHFASLHDSERPFRADALIQAVAQANDSFSPALALLVEKHCRALTDFTGELEQPLALVLGCGVGGTAVALAQSFPLVLAIDSCQRCIDAAKALQEQGCLSYTSVTAEGAKGVRRLARLPADIDASRINFMRADSESFVEEVDARSADAVVVDGLLTQLSHPAALLSRLPRVLRPGGMVAVETDYGWSSAVTAPAQQLAGPGAKPAVGQLELAAVMEAAGFCLVDEYDRAATTRLSHRHMCLSIHHCSLWRFRGSSM
mmetsp:Transcript_13812/g.41742  ORF Transcript_13812/g.41742 Transcript_13812/m.41742 type:complete len:329 (-) Transcript_13812:346-1332(-)|eukprot:CAMPEP_0206146280 /NCGR_PEP_ID=MMETSP1473-20131121/29887_1 /ASSEMBLY_ACC=CAM_ASM_001109 /TAXON_ID=1461547 /ORGANISM="Stichococcus sp, Strain RCC1054" /LENGTH=328 /DNA_ID=CAMNT_0053542775 /DNA_START=250 /DNA_END=1236 /DNA_ORIENTATION=-